MCLPLLYLSRLVNQFTFCVRLASRVVLNKLQAGHLTLQLNKVEAVLDFHEAVASANQDGSSSPWRQV